MKWHHYKIQKDIYKNLCKYIEMKSLSKKDKKDLYLAIICNHYQGKRFYTDGSTLKDKKSNINIPINRIYGTNRINLVKCMIAVWLQKECNYSYFMLIKQNVSPLLKKNIKSILYNYTFH